jgi:hypothetical protein
VEPAGPSSQEARLRQSANDSRDHRMGNGPRPRR